MNFSYLDFCTLIFNNE